MWQILLSRFSADPGWSLGSAIVIVLIIVLLMISFFRNVRQLTWFFSAGMVTAGIFLLATETFAPLMERLVAYRSDWSVVYLSQTLRPETFFTHFFLYFFLYAVLAAALILALGIWSLITLRWQRGRIMLRRAMAESWMVFLFALLTVLANILLAATVGGIDITRLTAVFQLMAFLFCLQLFLRLIDTAYLHSPQLLLEFTATSGLWMLLFHFLSEELKFLGQATPAAGMAQALFLQQLFSFFLAVMLLGILAHFLVRAWFASAFFLEQRHRHGSILLVWTTRVLLVGRDHSYAQQRIVLGVLLTTALGVVFLVLAFGGWYLALIPAFFLGYFLQFYLLDRQDDGRVKGDLVGKRIESAVDRLFFS